MFNVTLDMFGGVFTWPAYKSQHISVPRTNIKNYYDYFKNWESRVQSPRWQRNICQPIVRPKIKENKGTLLSSTSTVPSFGGHKEWECNPNILKIHFGSPPICKIRGLGTGKESEIFILRPQFSPEMNKWVHIITAFKYFRLNSNWSRLPVWFGTL